MVYQNYTLKRQRKTAINKHSALFICISFLEVLEISNRAVIVKVTLAVGMRFLEVLEISNRAVIVKVTLAVDVRC